MAPMVTQFAAPDGSVTQRLLNYLEERAKGGVGLIIPGGAFIDGRASKGPPNEIGVHTDSMIPGLNWLVETVQAYGVKIFLQLFHAGARASSKVIGMQPVAPSAISIGGETPRSLSITEIEEIIEMFGQAAERAKQAGFDGVEIHGAHGYLVHEFMSDYTNRRTDEFGGTFEARMKFPLAVVARVREYVGESYPVGMRINGDDYLRLEGKAYANRGITIEVAQRIARVLEAAGVDYLHITAGVPATADTAVQPMYYPPEFNVHLAEEIKRAVNIPVVAVGSITDPERADSILEEGKADLVAMGRAFIADPYWPRKAREGRWQDIRPCIRCNHCIARLKEGKGIKCSVNVWVGQEGEERGTKAKQPRRVLVIGGGPAGMEAARSAAERGHRVLLYERESRLGGMLVTASVPDFKRELRGLIDYYSTQLEKLGVEVQVEREVTLKVVKEVSPDAVIVATGAKMSVPKIPGMERNHVYTAVEVLQGKVSEMGDTIVIIGGGMVGCETALFLTKRGKRVTVIEMLDEILADERSKQSKLALIRRLKEKRVQIFTNTKVLSIGDERVLTINQEWREQTFWADDVVVATGLEPRRDLIDELRGLGIEVHAVGDCVKPRRIYEAIHDGAHVGNLI